MSAQSEDGLAQVHFYFDHKSDNMIQVVNQCQFNKHSLVNCIIKITLSGGVVKVKIYEVHTKIELYVDTF